MLVMTATPIPTSLALTRFGDLETSYLRQRPHGDGEPRVSTRLVTKAHRDSAYEEVRSAVRQGRQAYVVCALVDESDAVQARSANAEARRLQREVFNDLRVGLLTGKMTPRAARCHAAIPGRSTSMSSSPPPSSKWGWTSPMRR
jgi:ATP-dependent DNA helicase RecG